jgi:DNA-binding SARP family transcriptional activator
MGIYKQLGQPERAVAAYQRLEISLKTQLKVAPDKKTTELLDQIKVKKASRSKHA